MLLFVRHRVVGIQVAYIYNKIDFGKQIVILKHSLLRLLRSLEAGDRCVMKKLQNQQCRIIGDILISSY